MQYAGNDEFPIDAQLPDNGATDASDFDVPFEAAFDRTQWLHARTGKFRVINLLTAPHTLPFSVSDTDAGTPQDFTLVSSSAVSTVGTGGFVQPNEGLPVTLPVTTPTAFTVNQRIFIDGGGYYTVTANGGSTITVVNNGEPGNAVAGTTIPAGKVVGDDLVMQTGDIVEVDFDAGQCVLDGTSPGGGATGPFSLTLLLQVSINGGGYTTINGTFGTVVQIPLASGNANGLPATFPFRAKGVFTAGATGSLSVQFEATMNGTTAGMAGCHIQLQNTFTVARVWRAN